MLPLRGARRFSAVLRAKHRALSTVRTLRHSVCSERAGELDHGTPRTIAALTIEHPQEDAMDRSRVLELTLWPKIPGDVIYIAEVSPEQSR